MKLRKKVWLTFAGILVLALGAGFISYPDSPDIKIGDYFREIKVHLGLDLQGGTHLLYRADTTDIPKGEKAEALEGVRDVIERRVNAFGVSEPVVQTSKQGDEWRVIVELAGVQDVDQAIDMIGETPLLEFKEETTAELSEEDKAAADVLNQQKKEQAQQILDLAKEPEADFAALANEYSEDPGNIDQETGEKKGGDLGLFSREMMVAGFADVVFDELAVGEVYPEIVETQFGYHIIKKTQQEGDQAGARHILLAKQNTEGQTQFANTGLSGKNLERASVQFDPNTNEPQVSLDFDDEGKTLFGEITERNLNKVVGIYLDGSPISMPRVQQAITSGQAVITGDFTIDEAKQLARRLNAGALPVPIELVSQHNIGATLGELSVRKSLIAGLIGLLLVAVFMIVYYRLPGIIAVVALIIYSLIVLALFKLIPVTLTLAGIAGFILSIGMAVDANILIFERTKEELRNGLSLSRSIEEGFSRAWPSIRDSNISSLITCAILAWFGTSIIQGFAITLGIGVLVSMFSAITVTRTFMRLLVTAWTARKPGLFAIMPSVKNK